MRIDHIALRTFDRLKTAQFFIDAFGYRIQTEFDIYFNEEKTDVAKCIALEPPEKPIDYKVPFTMACMAPEGAAEYHLAPEIFVSEGSEGSIVGNWVKARGGAALHHIAYLVDSVEAKRKEWIEKGWGDFTSDKAFHCDGLTQIFTTSHKLTGIVFEFIERTEYGFCKDNVASLMKSTVTLDGNIK